jgi:hypothetical protein
MASFLPVASGSALIFAFRSLSLSFSETSGPPSHDLSCSHTLWFCFLVPNLVAQFVGIGRQRLRID